MKRCLLILSVLATCQWAGSAFAAEVLGVRSYRAPDHTRLVFDLDGPVNHSLFTLDDPNRIVVDINQTSMTANLESLNLNDTPLSSIRSAPRDGSDLRIVLDLHNTVQPRSFTLPSNEQYGHRLVVDLYDEEQTQPSASRSKPRTSNAVKDG
jgi:N-acetylmuramoyl-L-alanine amidase